MSLSSQFKTNVEKEQQGVGVKYAANEDGTIPEFIISRMGKNNRRYLKRLDAETKGVRHQIDTETLATEKAEEINLNVFVGSVLLGWNNILLYDLTGNPSDKIADEKTKLLPKAPFTKENAIKLLGRADLADLYVDLTTKASKATMFRDEMLETEAGN